MMQKGLPGEVQPSVSSFSFRVRCFPGSEALGISSGCYYAVGVDCSGAWPASLLEAFDRTSKEAKKEGCTPYEALTEIRSNRSRTCTEGQLSAPRLGRRREASLYSRRSLNVERATPAIWGSGMRKVESASTAQAACSLHVLPCTACASLQKP